VRRVVRLLSVVSLLLAMEAHAQAPLELEEARVELARHRLHATLEGGFAVVAEELVLETEGTVHHRPTTIMLRVPSSAELVAIEACQGGQCRSGSDVHDADEIFAHAQYGHRTPGTPPLVIAQRHGMQGDGTGLVLRIAGLDEGTAEVRVLWSAPTERLEGLERLHMPARETEAEVTLASTSLDTLSVDGDPSLERTPIGRAYDLVGRSDLQAPSVEVGAIDARGAGWIRAVAPSMPAAPRHVAILLDVSPSARELAGEFLRALSSLLDVVPAGSRVSILAFARRARLLADGPIESLRGQALAIPTDLGPSTSLAAALETLDCVEGAREATLLWLGDGGLAWGTRERRAGDALVARGGHVIVTGEHPSTVSSVIVAPSEDPLGTHARLSALFAPMVDIDIGDRVLRVPAGEASLVWLRDVGPSRSLASRSNVPPEAAAPLVRAGLGWPRARVLITLDPRDRYAANKTARGELGIFVAGGGLEGGQGRPSIRVCHCGWGYTPRGGISRGMIHRMMRSVRPAVTACFASARQGDPSYDARATYVLGFEGDELAHADVETDDPALRECMLAALDHLVVPELPAGETARTIFRYPFVTHAIEAPAPSPIDAVLAASLDRTFTTEPTVPPLSLLAPE
jgi:hypothetical protein